ncbi:HNH endonuclease [Pontibaca salina]|uniref:Putative HNH nuclease YajD n=1 Tax=Pontibaca salina TaxID=2795731 RepID=A0A934HPN6_9RHOB|nr:HNH endonuclease [Pontibaca salina]MBI6628275.1 HNH endonuclease [Pontibaca salina]
MGVKEHRRHSAKVTRTRRWKSLRVEALRRDNYKCVECGARGRLEIDHILPVRSHPELSFEIDNLQALCVSCHSKKTIREIGLHKPDPEIDKWRDLLKSGNF